MAPDGNLKSIPAVLAIFVRYLLYAMVAVIALGLLLGIGQTLVNLILANHSDVETFVKSSLLNTIILLALFEVFNTALNYLAHGRVRVTFVIDTVLIVMLNEVLSLWFSGNITILIPLLVCLSVLMAIRVFAIRFSPKRD